TFRAVNGRGLSVLVRRKVRETAAEIWLRPPGELKEFLERWVSAVEQQATQAELENSEEPIPGIQ
ncbi:MAG: hypothetical protein ABSF70_18355, partial [Terracidiphilus sp.]